MHGARAHFGVWPVKPRYRSPSGNSTLVKPEDLIRAARIVHRKSRAVHGDTIQLVGQPALRAGPTDALDTLAKSLSNCLGLGLSGELCQRAGKLFRLFTSDVQRHESPRVDI